MSLAHDVVEFLKKVAYKHLECEDCYYSCPKAEGYCGGDVRAECTCWCDQAKTLLAKIEPIT